jgi:light-regulated signal transduction histidine kinase (bacteriophytochrome)
MISMYLDMLVQKYKGKLLDEEAEEYIRIAGDGARRLKNLIDDLLKYSRIGTGVLEYQTNDGSALVDQVLRDLQIPIKESGTEVTRDPLPTIVGDPIQLGQLFQNLITNAIKFRNPDLSPRIHISAKQTGRFFTFTVRDNGIGFEMEQEKHIFAVFRRLHNKDEYPGTGIGLASCKKIVESHGGSIWAESQPGKGSTFFFTIAVLPTIQELQPE